MTVRGYLKKCCLWGEIVCGTRKTELAQISPSLIGGPVHNVGGVLQLFG